MNDRVLVKAKVPAEVWRAIKLRAALTDKALQTVFEDALRSHLAGELSEVRRLTAAAVGGER